MLKPNFADPGPFGSSIQHLRREIANRALFRTLPPEKRSILADVIAKRMLDRIVEWAATGNSSSIMEWIESLLREHPKEARLHNLLPSTVSATLDVLSEQTRIPIEKRRALTDLQRRIDMHVAALRSTQTNQISSSVDPVDAKIDDLLFRLSAQDSLTAEHSRSVGMWCRSIAKRLNLPRSEAYLVTRSGLLHDIGKSATPLEILTAERKLNDDEWVIMRQHAAQGEAIVNGLSNLRQFAPAVRSHHERFDGKGYPDNLERSSIPFVARIVSVADAFNAMIARRPYRAPLSPTHAIEELKRNSGTQFDPAAVEAMIDVVVSGR